MKLFLFLILFFSFSASHGQDWFTVNKKSLEYYRQGKYNEAIVAADEALQMATFEYGKSSDQYLSSLTNKAYAQSAIGDYLQSIDNFRQASDISLKLFHLPHVSQVETFGEVSKAFMLMAAYDSSEHYLGLARTIFTSVPEKNKPHYDTALFQLFDAYIKINSIEASLRHHKGQLTQAIQLLEAQVGMLKELYPDGYEDVADYQTTLSNLTTYYNEAYVPDKALYYALEYYRLIGKKNNTLNRIHALQNLGSIYNTLEQYDSASLYWHRALTLIASEKFDNLYIQTAILNNMGTLHLSLENYDSAIYYLNISLDIQSRSEALRPVLNQTTIFNLAEAYHWVGEYTKADSAYNILIRGVLDDIIHNFTYLSDDEKIAFYKNQVSFINDFMSFAVKISAFPALQGSDQPYINPAIPGRLYNVQLTTKGIILNASKRMRNSILISGDSVLIARYIQWEERKNQLAQMLMKENSTAVQINTLKSTIEENEKWLTTHSRRFTSGFQQEEIDWRQIQKTLKPGEAAVEIIRLINGLVYGALVITPETKEQPVLSLVISKESKLLEKQSFQNYSNSIIYQLTDTLSYKTYWQPIIDSIRVRMKGGKMPKRIYVSNDGIYNQINLNTLFNPITKQFVIDQTDIVIVTNTKEILQSPKKEKASLRKDAALFGRPQFSGNMSSLFADLPGTEKEVLLLDQLLSNSKWKSKVYTGAAASETNLKNLNSPGILHLASHGFFNAGQGGQEQSFVETMMRSGIALSVDTLGSTDDGLLTAFEVITLNLDSTRLVVLSACETGRGEITNGEGVYGLQRALHVAGVKNMVMSLWKVDDTATQKLMVEFYTRWIKTGNMRLAFSEAQKSLRAEYPNPYYWGAFILAGM